MRGGLVGWEDCRGLSRIVEDCQEVSRIVEDSRDMSRYVEICRDMSREFLWFGVAIKCNAE